MAKCIKSITAGLLHLEVLGKVPDTGGKRPRARRQGPTSPGNTIKLRKSRRIKRSHPLLYKKWGGGAFFGCTQLNFLKLVFVIRFSIAVI